MTKKAWKKDEGVSPVIATILMVAITVVLAAVLYVMVMQYINIKPPIPVSGSLDYRTDVSNPTSGQATFEVTLGTPSEAYVGEVGATLLRGTVEIPLGTNAWANWTHIGSTDDKVKTGDRITIEAPGVDLRGCEVILTIGQYSGTLKARVP